MTRRNSKQRREKIDRNERRSGRNEKRNCSNEVNPNEYINANYEKPSYERIRALTEAQGHYIIAIQQSDIVFGIGSAGTGKSFVAATMACDMLRDKKIQKIIITRPNVEAGDSMGFLPGSLEEKYEPFFRPFRKILDKRLGSSVVDALIKNGYIEAMPIGFMRGDTLDNCWIIADEAQNFTIKQMKLLLSRVGKNCKIIVDGDVDQYDIKEQGGLIDAMKRLSGISEISSVTFSEDDCVRSKLCKKILKAYSDVN